MHESFQPAVRNPRYEERDASALPRKLLGILHSRERVVDRHTSHVHPNPAIDKYLPMALAKIDGRGREFFIETIDFGETIGGANCVETTDGDDIIYARRVGRSGLTRFVRNRERTDTSQLTVILKKIEDGYILISGFVGPRAEPEPWDPKATPAAAEFWKSHAVVWGSEPVGPGSETTTPETQPNIQTVNQSPSAPKNS